MADINEVNFDEITDGCPSGDGVFDQLLRSVKAHLKEEYDGQRIRGSEYSQVYMSALGTSMSQAIQWQLGAELAKNQALLIEKQIEGQEKQNLLLDEQRALLIAQTAQVESQTRLSDQQLQNVIAELANIPKQGDLLDAQTSKVTKDEDFVEQQTLTEVQNTAAALYNVDTMLPAQKEKVDTEISVLAQKKYTEEAQTKDTVNSAPVTGLIGKQKDLYTAQADGFARDAEQKAARIISDSWGIAVSANTAAEDTPSESSPGKLDEVFRQLREGADILGDVT